MAHFLPTVTIAGVTGQVGQTRYTAPLGPDDQFRVRIETSQGRVDDFTVLYLTRVAGQWRPVARYDCAHRHPHRDLLDADGAVVEKLWLAGWPLAQALDHAIADIKAHWPRYRADFLRRLS
jgi:hypothetical protein